MGSLYLRQGQIQLAYDYLKQATKLRPDYPQALFQLGNIFMIDHNYKAAKEVAASLKKNAKYAHEALLIESQIASSEGNLDAAIQKYQDAEKQSQTPLKVKWLVYLADLYVRKGDRPSAEAVIRKHKQSDMDADDLISLAKYYLKNQDNTRARSYFQNAIQRFPRNPEVHYIYGEYLFSMRKFLEAVNYYKEALEIMPNLPVIEYKIGQALLEAGKLEDLRKHIDQMLAANSQNIFALRLKAQYHLSLNQRQEAIDTLKILVKANLYAPTPQILLSSLYLQEGKLSLSTFHAKKALSQGDLSTSPHVILANIYYQKGQYQQAKDHLEKVLGVDPNNLPVLLLLGDTYLNLGQFQLAEEQYGKAMARYPTIKALKSKLVWSKAMGGNPVLALQMARQSWQEMPEDIDTLASYVNTLAVNNRLNDAIAAVMIHVKQRPKDWRLHYLLGDLYLLKKAKDSALASYQRALTLNPDDINTVLNLSSRYAFNGLEKEAEKMLLRLQKKYPKNILIANQLSWLYIETMNAPEKAASLITLLESEAEEATVMDTVGWYYFKTGNLPYATYFLDQAAKLEPESRAISSHLDAALQKINPSK